MSIKQEQCPVCQFTQTKHLFTVARGQLVSCQNCNLVYYTPRPTPEELADFYNSATYREDFQHSTMAGQAFAKARYDRLQSLISRYAPFILAKSNKRLLDIGCGTGDLLHVAAADGWEITGTEISPLAVEKANAVLESKVLVGDVLSLDLPENYYDVITVYHVIEHLLSPVDTLTRIKQLLSPDGVAFIETPNIGSLGAKIKREDWSQIKPPEHITYFRPSSLQHALKESDFQNFRVFTVSPLIIESVSIMPLLVRQATTSIYKLAPLIGLGATLQALVLKK